MKSTISGVALCAVLATGCGMVTRSDARVRAGWQASVATSAAAVPLADSDDSCGFRCSQARGSEGGATLEVGVQYARRHSEHRATAVALRVPVASTFTDFQGFAPLLGTRLDVFHTLQSGPRWHAGIGLELNAGPLALGALEPVVLVATNPAVYAVITRAMEQSSVSVTARAISGFLAYPMPGMQLQLALNRGTLGLLAGYMYFPGESGVIDIGFKDFTRYQFDHVFVVGLSATTP